ncbi:MAG: zinc-binding dehydrogenase [Chloroflexota bacterium]
MKIASVTGDKQAAVIDVPQPQAKENWVVVKIMSSPMCTEYKAFQHGHETHFLGHEAAGEVVEVAQPCRVKVGDRVVVMPQTPCGTCPRCLEGEYIHCQDSFNFGEFHGSAYGASTMGQYLVKQDWMLVPIPDGISYDHGAMACCGLGPTFGALQRVNAGVLDTVLITGLGPVGLGGVINASYRGCRVIGVDTNKWRAAKAIELGAEAVIDPMDEDALDQILALTENGRGVDHSIDCSGVSAAHRTCIDATRRQGTVTFVGESGGNSTPLYISNDMIRKGLHLHGSWHYNIKYTPDIMHVIANNTEKLDSFISHRFDIDNIQDAFELQLTGQCSKVMLKPWG